MEGTDTQWLLHDCFARQALQTPGAVALRFDARTITYAELAANVGRIATGLRASGLGPGSVIGLHIERSIDYVGALLGVLTAGAAAAPLPPSYPPGRLRELVGDARLSAVIDAAATRLDRSFGKAALAIETLLATELAPQPAPAVRPDDPALVLSTSGTTGRPKLIVRSHRSFFHRLQWTWARYPYAPGESCCQKSFMTTTHAVYELFEPLLQGVPVLIVSDADVRHVERFWQILRAARVTRLLIVPSALQAALDAGAFEPPPLSLLVLMGEPVPPQLASRLVEALPTSTDVVSIYGSTEASSTLVVDLRADRLPGGELPLGEPLSDDVHALVLTPDMHEAAAGEPGVLHIGGTSLFSGYLGDPELTARSLVRAPGVPEPLYDTRDRVRRLPDGRLQFLGRIDHTVKIRGFRVDLQDVEHAMLAVPGVSQAAALVASIGESGTPVLAAVYTPASLDAASLYVSLRANLPDYLVPSTLLARDRLPLTASGKLDRLQLQREFEAGLGHAAAAATHAWTATEQQVAEVWRSVLGHGAFGPDSSFFEVGGSSLSVMATLHRLRRTFGLDRARLHDAWFYGHPTVPRQAAAITALLAGSGATDSAGSGMLVTLRAGRDPSLPPLFMIASAGGTTGPYDRLARALATRREIIGVRDAFLWGGRDAALGFDHWVEQFLEAMRRRQPEGPYHVCAYSSAGAFGYELARRLRAGGATVALLVLVDPLGLDRGSQRRFGYWAMRATYASRPLRALIRVAGRLRAPFVGEDRAPNVAASAQPIEPTAPDAALVLGFSALLELGTGLSLALEPADVAGRSPVEALLERIATVAPEFDLETVARMLQQYPLQTAAQNAFRLQRYDGEVLLVEPATPYAGLLELLLRPYAARLEATQVALGQPTARQRELSGRFGALAAHYLCMREERFVAGLATAIDARLD